VSPEDGGHLSKRVVTYEIKIMKGSINDTHTCHEVLLRHVGVTLNHKVNCEI